MPIPLGERSRKVLELLREGVYDAEIARRLGCSRERVRQIRARAGIPRLPRSAVARPRLDRAVVAKALALHRAGATWREVATKLGGRTPDAWRDLISKWKKRGWLE